MDIKQDGKTLREKGLLKLMIKECFKLLKDYKGRLTKQQYRTFKGQILNGDIEGFRKGLFNLMKLQYTK